MIESALIVRWLVSIVILVLLLFGFVLLLRIVKAKGYVKALEKTNDRMHLIEQFHLDSKNKIVKVKDGDSVLTLLVGSSVSMVKEEKIKNLDLEKEKV